MADHEDLSNHLLLEALKTLAAERDEERRLRLALQAEAATTSSMLSSGLHRISARASTSAPPAPLPTSAPPVPLPTSTEYSYGLPALASELLSKLEALATHAAESLSDRDEEVHALKNQLAALQAKLDVQRPSEVLPLLAEQIGSASRLHHDKALPTLRELKAMLHHDKALPTLRELNSMLHAAADEVGITIHAAADEIAVLTKRLQEAEQKLRDGEKLRKKQLNMNVSMDRPPWRF